MFESKKVFKQYVIMWEVMCCVFPILGELGHGYFNGMPLDSFDIVFIVADLVIMNLIGAVIVIFQMLKQLK